MHHRCCLVAVSAGAVLVLGACGPPLSVGVAAGEGSAAPEPGVQEPAGGDAGDEQVLLVDCDDLTDEPIVDGPLSEDPTVAWAQQHRAMMPLPSDIETVEALMAGERGPLSTSFQFPVLESEADDFFDRPPEHDIDVMEVVHAYLESDPAAAAAFGGAWVDVTRGGTHVAFTHDIAAHEAALGERLPPDLMPVVVERTHSFDDLMAARDAIVYAEGGMENLESDIGIELLSVSPMADASRVSLGVHELDEEKRRLLSERYDPGLFCVHDDVPMVPAPG